MFEGGNNKRTETETIIGPTVHVEGNFTGSGDVVVEGRLSGTLKTDKSLRVGEQAHIKADVEANDVFVAGEIRGNVKAKGRLELAPSGKVFGNVETASLIVSQGAILHGKCIMAAKEMPLAEPAPAKRPIKDANEK